MVFGVTSRDVTHTPPPSNTLPLPHTHSISSILNLNPWCSRSLGLYNMSIMVRDDCTCSVIHWSLFNGTWQKRPRNLGLYNVSIVFSDDCICSVLQSCFPNGMWQKRPRDLGLYNVSIVFSHDCICSVLQSHSPISISLVSFTRNVAKEI